MEFQDFKEIKELVQETEALFSEVDSKIKELSDKQDELQEKVNEHDPETVDGVVQSAKDKDLYEHITKAKNKLVEKRNELQAEGAAKRANKLSNLIKGYQNNVINKTIMNSPEFERVKEIWAELLEIEAKAQDAASQQNKKMATEARKILAKGYIPSDYANRANLETAQLFEPISYSKELYYALRAGKAPFEGK